MNGRTGEPATIGAYHNAVQNGNTVRRLPCTVRRIVAVVRQPPLLRRRHSRLCAAPCGWHDGVVVMYLSNTPQRRAPMRMITLARMIIIRSRRTVCLIAGRPSKHWTAVE